MREKKGNKACGFVLFYTLIMISVLGIIILSYAQLVFLYDKSQHHIAAHHQSLHQLEKNSLILSSIDNARCFIAAHDPNESLEKIRKNPPCTVTVGSHRYGLAIENLGSFPCIYLKQNQLLLPTYHQRLTLRDLDDNTHVLQLRLAKPTTLASVCASYPTVVKSSVISWRYL